MAQEAVSEKAGAPVSDADRVADRLRQAIVAGEFAPRQRLIESDLIEMFGASRGAVRSALAVLAVEGLVERIRNRGARVRAVDLEEALEIVEIRAALESLCARRAAERVDEEGASRLRGIAEVMRRAVGEHDAEGYSEANRALHQAVLDISGARVAPDIVSRLRAQNVRYRIRLAMQPHRPAESLPEHLEIVEAICAQDPGRAAEAMQAHLRSVHRATKEYFTEARG
ncbi:GntR family transcriptional regulator [Sediminivirga luteola]|uniref:Transcriptional regulator n=1 Tax=Sediminivirga luteola TaxID=1774748 RepID=A0A8J2XF87_9MICO|nr:GntR family transcriptional regulator [Sediminivirga luteola]MCI2266256.1 GntR family transcriptional regulator [Sediminivirga luteola]GGA12135.1 transcriptional regulator [Sediminivirga luteola]